jgi:mannose-6-phosphate isomerase-like protein (cupin superfamily)
MGWRCVQMLHAAGSALRKIVRRAAYNGRPFQQSAADRVAISIDSRAAMSPEPFTMKIIRSRTFTAERPWGALDIASMRGITTRLHWTDQPYRWHINDGEEVFVVLDGRVEMRYRIDGAEHSTVLEAGDIFHASVGTEHVAYPLGEARILVVETDGSV